MTVTRESTHTPKADSHPCQISDAGGLCASDAIVWIANLDANGPERDAMAKMACAHHASRAFQVVGASGGSCTPRFLVIPLGSLAERIRVSVPVDMYMP